MKKPIQKLTDEDLAGYPIRDLVPGGFFRLDEISQGYYQVTGTDRWGRQVSRQGIKPEQLLRDCQRDAQEFSQD